MNGSEWSLKMHSEIYLNIHVVEFLEHLWKINAADSDCLIIKQKGQKTDANESLLAELQTAYTALLNHFCGSVTFSGQVI